MIDSGEQLTHLSIRCSSRDVMTTKNNQSQSPPLLTKIYYVDLVLIALTVIFGTIGLLFPKVPLLIWLPSLLLLCSSCVSLSALIYLSKGIALRSRDNLLFYILLTVVLIRIVCASLLLIGVFVPHAVTWISISLATISQAHAIFGLIAVGKVTFFRLGLDKRNTWKDAKFSPHRIEEIAIVNLSDSRVTLVTNVDEGELVHFDSS
uniref:7TM_GPCR_Srx domain-containing protein n=1 Tax=Angiostrongylus cantonensis TaxID=6313 RepID=A0A158P659_ANGCA